MARYNLGLIAYVPQNAPSLVSRGNYLGFSDTVDGGVDENLIVDVIYVNTLSQTLQVLLRSRKACICQLLG